MPLSREEFRRRVVAGAALHGCGMRGLRDLLGEFGTERTLAEEMIRNEDARKRRRNLRDLAETLSLPQSWFTEPDWWTLVKGASKPPDESESVDEVARRALADLEQGDEEEEATG